MTIFRNITELGKGIAARHGWPAAKAFKAYAMTEADRAALSHCAIELLSLFPPVAGASVLMSAALAVMLERRMQAPVQVVAGTLAVDGAPVFGNRQPLDGAALFADANPAWDGHAWVMVGPYVADVALFRAAYAAW
ncbi:MAG TPA: hypothetical protein VFF94_03160, partial [Novosphingobium sp.]|nr:hypothetical protein [Novosphingobium sp.]